MRAARVAREGTSTRETVPGIVRVFFQASFSAFFPGTGPPSAFAGGGSPVYP